MCAAASEIRLRLNFKMAPAAILNLLPVSITVTWPFSVVPIYISTKFRNVSQPAATLLRFMENSIIVMENFIIIIELLFGNDGPPIRSSWRTKVAFQISCWRSLWFWRYPEFKISQIWLKMPLTAPKKSRFGVLTPKHYFSLLRLQGAFLAENTF